MCCIVWPEYFETICVAWHLIQLYCHSYRCLFYDLRAVIGREKIYRCKDRNNLIDKYERQIITIDFIYNVHRFCVNWRLYCVKCKTASYAICSGADFGKLCTDIVFVNVLIFFNFRWLSTHADSEHYTACLSAMQNRHNWYLP